mmetsp:Transcript_39707/g.97598  ORF Transcript_39707/g.97598 Transcript_39707/m.97598 type:complete len:756 (-) Transcript_39707:545-2812(-)
MEEACRRGDLEQIKLMVRVDPKRARKPDATGSTPLHRVAGFNHREVADFLIANNADVNAEDRYAEAPLKRAAYDGHTDVATLLIACGADVNHEDISGKAAIHHAAEQGRAQVLEVLIESGSIVNHETKEYYTPLHLAAVNGHPHCCRVLVAAGAHVDSQGGPQHMTPLHMAALWGHTQAAKVLIDEQADVDLKDKQGRKPALLAKDQKTRDLFDSVFLRRYTHAPACTASGPGLDEVVVADDNCMFIIEARDRFGAPLKDPGGFLEYSVEVQDLNSGEQFPASVTYNYKLLGCVCHYDGSRVGSYLVHVRLENGQTEGRSEGHTRMPIKGSPFHVQVKHAPLDPYTSRVTGNGVLKPPAGQRTEFVVHGRDRYGNRSPGGTISVYTAPNNHLPMDLEIKDQGGGDYLVSYTAPPESCRVNMSVAVEGGRHVYNSPFTVFVMPGPAVPGESEVDGRGAVRTGVDLESVFHLHPRDTAGNHLIYGGLTWQVGVHPDEQEQTGLASQIEVRVDDKGDGVYVCKYVPKMACVHTLRVLLNNKHVKGSPFKVSVLEMPEWGPEEVADMFHQMGFSQYADAVIRNEIHGHMLQEMSVDTMEFELGIQMKSHQSKLVNEVRRYMAQDDIEWDDYGYPDDHILVQMGVNGLRLRWRIAECMAEADVQTELAGYAEGQDAVNARMQTELYAHAEKIMEELRQAIEGVISLSSQTLVTDLNTGKIKDGFGLTRAMQNLEQTLKRDLITCVRSATLPEGAEDEMWD